MYPIFYWIHTISWICWLLAFLFSLIYYNRATKSKNGSPIEKKYVLKERKVTNIGAHIGAVGILISGGAMASIPGGPKWGWFNFADFGWLATKQVIFFVILALVVVSIIRSVRFKKQMRAEEMEGLTDESRGLWKKAYTWSVIVYLLVLVNTVLGLTRPF